MTNETTASQPKSIGDDAMHTTVLDSVAAYKDWVSTLAVGVFVDPYYAFVAGSRAPAAQASATIQAAPEGWTVEFDKYTLPGTIRLSSPKWGGCFLGKPTSSDTVLSSLMYRYFADLLAATIQEPVMVAEPVGDTGPTHREALIACLGDDAATLSHINPDDEMAQTMRDAIAMLESDEVVIATLGMASSQPTDGGVRNGRDLEAVHAFLMGESPLEGVQFGDKHPTKAGAQWWRLNLRAALAKG